MGLLSKIWGGIKKLFKISPIGLLIDWLTPDPPAKEAVKIPSEGSDRPVPVVYGKALVGGVKIHKWVSDIPGGMKRGYLHIIVAWAAGEIDGIEKVYLNDKDANSPDFVVGGDRLWERWDSLGGENATAIPEAVANIPNWTANHRGRGVAHSYFRFRMDADRQVWSGEPQIKAVIRGRRVFDPRTGTAAWSDNPALCLLDFLKSSRYGKGLPSSRINEQSFIDAANFCDQGTSNTITSTTYIPSPVRGEPPTAVTTTTTTTKKRFTLNIAVVPQDGITNAVNDIRRNFRASLPQGNGVIRLEVERDKSSVFSFGANDIGGEIDYKAGSKKDRYNQVIVRFPNENKDYEKDEVAWPDRSSQDYIDFLEADNGIPLEQSFEFDGITKKHEALQMAEVICKRSRVNAQVAFTSANPKAILLEPTDIIDITDDTFGWQNKEFRITDIEPAEDGTVNISAIEYNPTVYPWNGATFDETIGGTWLGDPTYLPPPSNVQMVQDTTLSSTGTLTWQHEADAFVRRYEIVIERAGEVIFDVDVIGRSWSVPLLDAGEYTATVYAVGTLTGNRSGGAAYAFTLAAPVAPTSIALTPRDWEIEAAAQLAGIGLGTVFEYDITSGDGVGYTPTPKGRATTFTFTGLLPNTLYTVFARAINAYGISDWVSASATTTNTGAQVDQYLQTIRDELDAVETVIGDIDTSLPSIDDLLERVSQDVIEIFQRREDVNNEQEKRKRQYQGLSVEIQGINNAINTRIDEVAVDVDGNATAISGLQLEVNDLGSDLSSTISRIDEVKLDVDGNASAINVLQGKVDDPVNNSSALYGFVQQAQTTANENATSITDIYSGVTGETNKAAALLKLQSYLNEGGLGARAFLGTDVNNRVTGIVVNDDGTNRQIEFQSNSVVFLDGNSQPMIYFDNVNGRYVFDGHIIAQTGTFSGTVSSASIVGGDINIGSGTFTVDSSGNMVARSGSFYGSITTAEDNNTGYFTHTDPTPFGTTGDLVEWYGEKINGVTWNNATKTAIPSGMSKLNAKTYKTKNGSVFFGGTFQAGTLSLSRQTTNKTGTMTVATGTFTIPGGTSTIVVAASAVASGGGTGLGTCPLSLPSTSTIVNIERLVGGTWQNIGGSSSVAQFQCSQEGPEMLININAGAAASTSLSVTPGEAITLRATASTAQFPTTVEGVFIDGSRSLSIAVTGE